MAMGKRKEDRQDSFWIPTSELPKSAGHPFYDKLNEVLAMHDFDQFVESQCESFYAGKIGRPSLPPSVYFRLLLIGYFEGIDSERGIAWRVGDSMALRSFIGYALTDATPDHSTISRNRRLIDLQTHQQVFTWVLQLLAKSKLLSGKTVGVDSSTLEANAALRSIIRRDTGESYQDFLKRLAIESGIETPTREDLAKLDKTRKNKGSNDDWAHPHDPDAKITKMKDGRTHLAHKVEHAVDFDTQALLAVTLQPAHSGDTSSIGQTVDQVDANLVSVMEDEEAVGKLHDSVLSELVGDKGYHSNDVLTRAKACGIRSYISEPDRGRRNWKGKTAEQRAEKAAARDAVYANRRRIKGDRGKSLMKKRGELLERSFAHCYDTGGMRRTHLRTHDNILKRLLIHTAGFNLGLVMRKSLGFGTSRGLQGRLAAMLGKLRQLVSALCDVLAAKIIRTPYTTWPNTTRLTAA